MRVETRSLLGPQDSTSVLDFMISANARAAALDCDGSLSDDDSVDFVLADPAVLAQERDVKCMPPPRPSRRRRMSPAPVSASVVVATSSTHANSTDTTTQKNISGDSDRTRAAHLTPNTGSLLDLAGSQMNVPNSRHGRVDEKLSPKLTLDTNRGLLCPQPSIKMKSAGSVYDHKYFDRFQPIESCSSLVGLVLVDNEANARPHTPVMMTDTSMSSSASTPSSSNSSVRISRSDADNVHLTIASMASIYQHPLPTFMTCRS